MKHRSQGFPTLDLQLISLGWDLRMCISYPFPGDGPAGSLRATVEQWLLGVILVTVTSTTGSQINIHDKPDYNFFP